MRPDREQRKRADGTEIDAVKNLAEFVQSFPQAPPEPTPIVTPKPVAAPEGQASPSPAPQAPPEPAAAPDHASEVARLQREIEQHKQEAARVNGELQAARTRQEAEAATRRVLAEQAAAAQKPTPKPEDPRWAALNDAWYTDPAKARDLLIEIQRDEQKQALEAQRATIKQEVFAELTEKQRYEQANRAFHSTIQKLQSLGVKPEQINTNRVNALYATVTRKPTDKAPNPYYDAGGPLNETALMDAWRELYGLPDGGGAGAAAGDAGAPTPAPIPAAAVPAPPPGSSRPAPAAGAPRVSGDRLPALSAADKRDIEQLAKVFGHDPEKLMQKRRERLAKERA